jgi:hypothetical protein
MSELRKLIDHLTYIDEGGQLIRELDAKTGRVISKPVPAASGKKWPTTDAEIRAFQRANPPLKDDGMIGQQTLGKLRQLGYVPPPGFKPVADKAIVPGAAPVANQAVPSTASAKNLGSNAAGNISDFSAGPVATSKSQSASSQPADAEDDDDSSSGWNPPTAGRNADGSYNSDHPFVKAMDAKMARNKNPNGNGGHEGSGIDPNADPEDAKIWPKGITKASDFGYLDANGMWIPTPFHVRTANGDFKIPRTSPANRIGIPNNQLSPFQKAVQQMEYKSTLSSASAIEQVKFVKLPNGAPDIPGFQQVDASKFSNDAREPGLNKFVDWVYAYQRGKDFVLIAPMLFYNNKISIGRHYANWTNQGIKTDDDRVPSANGTVFVANQSFNANDMILTVVVNTSIGAGNIGPQILKRITASGGLTPV